MAISRPLLFALIGALVLLVAVTAVRVLGSASAEEAPAPQAAATAADTQPSVAPDSAQPLSSINKPDASAAKPDAAASKPEPSRQAADKPAEKRRPDGIPPRVAKALDKREVVVLFFGAQGHDDRATRRAARALRGDAQVFTESVNHLDDYTRVVGALPLSQLPATIVIDRDRQARVIEGFADAGSLRQLVADAR